jgi:D-xylose 1-dehydrogenase (NADP+, D-xylono-1,5-lactone-forming)
MASGRRIRWGILGTGEINVRFLPGARQSEDVEMVAVASRDPERATAFAGRHSIPRSFGSYEDMLADPEIDAVYICLPNSLHHPWTMKTLAAGKHVLCEKPYTRRPAEVIEAFAAADRAGLILMEAFMWRHTPQTRRLVELLPTIGDLQHIRSSFSFGLDNLKDIRVSPELDGGSLMDVGCYCVSGSRLIAGAEPESVFGVSTAGPTGVDVRFTGILRFANGLVAELNSAFTSNHRGLEAIGSEGSILVPDPWLQEAGLLIRNGEEIRVEPTNAYRLELENMAAAIRGEAPPLLGRDDALGQARTIAALYESVDSNAPVACEIG